jgi:hypothetical protein
MHDVLLTDQTISRTELSFRSLVQEFNKKLNMRRKQTARNQKERSHLSPKVVWTGPCQTASHLSEPIDPTPEMQSGKQNNNEQDANTSF